MQKCGRGRVLFLKGYVKLSNATFPQISHLKSGLFPDVPNDQADYHCVHDGCGELHATRWTYMVHLALAHKEFPSRLDRLKDTAAKGSMGRLKDFDPWKSEICYKTTC